MSTERQIRGLWLGTKEGSKSDCEIVTVADDLSAYYDLLNCEFIDIARVKVRGREFEIVCDDEGLFVENNPVRFTSADFKYRIVGNIFVCALDENSDGELRGLTDSELKVVKSRLAKDMDVKTGEARTVLIGDMLL